LEPQVANRASCMQLITSSRSSNTRENMPSNNPLVPIDDIATKIHFIRGQKVMLDSDLAELYGVQTKYLIKQVNRNSDRFPSDFMFSLVNKEVICLRFQIGTSKGRGGRRYRPYAFTEQGVAMLSGVLRSKQAIQVNILIMRAFVQLRHMIATNEELARKLDSLENKYDARFRVVFDAIRRLMTPPESDRRRIGFDALTPNEKE